MIIIDQTAKHILLAALFQLFQLDICARFFFKYRILRKIVIIFVSWYIHQFENICFGCSKEQSHWNGSFEYPQHMFEKKNNFFTNVFKNAPTFSKNYYKIQPWVWDVTLFILMDYPIHIDTTRLKYGIVHFLYFKGLPVKISIKWYISVPEDLYLSK